MIPRAADVFSAWGMLMSDLRRDYFVTRLLSLSADNAERLGALLDEVTGASLELFAGEGIAAEQVRFLRYGNLRYENQEHGVEVQLPDGDRRDSGRGDHRELPRLLRARVHVPTRRAGRVRRGTSSRSPRSASSRRCRCRPPGGRSTTR